MDAKASGRKLMSIDFKGARFATSQGCMLIIRALDGRVKKSGKVRVKGVRTLLRGLNAEVRGQGLYYLLKNEVALCDHKKLGMLARRQMRIFGLSEDNFDGAFLSWHEEFHRQFLYCKKYLLQ